MNDDTSWLNPRKRQKCSIMIQHDMINYKYSFDKLMSILTDGLHHKLGYFTNVRFSVESLYWSGLFSFTGKRIYRFYILIDKHIYKLDVGLYNPDDDEYDTNIELNHFKEYIKTLVQ